MLTKSSSTVSYNCSVFLMSSSGAAWCICRAPI